MRDTHTGYDSIEANIDGTTMTHDATHRQASTYVPSIKPQQCASPALS